MSDNDKVEELEKLLKRKIIETGELLRDMAEILQKQEIKIQTLEAQVMRLEGIERMH